MLRLQAYPLDFIAHKFAFVKTYYHDTETATLIGLAGVVVALIYWLSSHSRQIYIKGVPFVGGSDEDAIKDSDEEAIEESDEEAIEDSDEEAIEESGEDSSVANS